ncbi:MAG: hypothetical protein ABI645_06380 [Pseudomonadota bacterium]
MKTKSRLAIVVAVALALPPATMFGAQAAAPSRNALPQAKGPCDIYSAVRPRRKRRCRRPPQRALTIKVVAAANISVGDTLTIDTGGRKELATVRSVTVSVVAAEGAGGATPGAANQRAP